MDATSAAPEGCRPGPGLRVGSVEIAYLRRDEALAAIDRAFKGGPRVRVAFCNANTMLKALRSSRYARALGSFLLLNDGLGMDLCSWLLNGRRFDDNLNGTDLVPALLRSSSTDLSIYLIGGAPGTAEAAARRLGRDYPRHRIVGVRDGFFTDAEAAGVAAAVRRAAPDLLLVGMGNPRQEEFIDAQRAELDVPVSMAVGAFLDFTAGNVVRAPGMVRALRAEWLFRLALEPRRLWRRYTVDVVLFVVAILVLRLRGPRRPDDRLETPRTNSA